MKHLRKTLYLILTAALLWASPAQTKERAPLVSKPTVTYERVSPKAKAEDFTLAMNVVAQRMLESYRKDESRPLFMEILNSAQQAERRFFDSISHSPPGSSGPPVMSMTFTADAKVNGQKGGLCLLQFDSSRAGDLLHGYERSGIFDKRDIVYYLAAHEFGHCMVFHQTALGKHIHVSNKGHELLADKIAIAFFMVNGHQETAKKVIAFNERLVSGELHSHPNELKAFYRTLSNVLADDDVPVKSMLDLLTLAQLD